MLDHDEHVEHTEGGRDGDEEVAGEQGPGPARGTTPSPPIGPYIATGLDPSQQRVITRVNGVVRQDGNSRDLVFSVPYLIAYLSKYMTLLPGDLIMTGTPAGVGPISVGDTIEVEIPGIGVLRNSVVSEEAV